MSSGYLASKSFNQSGFPLASKLSYSDFLNSTLSDVLLHNSQHSQLSPEYPNVSGVPLSLLKSYNPTNLAGELASSLWNKAILNPSIVVLIFEFISCGGTFSVYILLANKAIPVLCVPELSI